MRTAGSLSRYVRNHVHPFLGELVKVIEYPIFFRSIGDGYDLYHVTNPTLSPLLNMRRPSIVTVHDMVPFTDSRGIQDVYIRKNMGHIRGADAIICVSQFTKSELLRIMDGVLDKNMVSVVYLGIDHDVYKPRGKVEARKVLGLPLDRVIILNVGTEEQRKNIPALLEVVDHLKKVFPDILLVRVGSRSGGSASIIKQKELEDNVVYRIAPDDRIQYYYNAADLLLHPAYLEGFGLPVLEGMASGIPVICGNKTALPEVAGDGAICVDAFDVDAMVQSSLRLLSDENMRSRLIDKALIRGKKFSYVKCALETMQVYEDVMRSQS